MEDSNKPSRTQVIDDLAYDLKNLQHRGLISELDIRSKSGISFDVIPVSESLEIVFSFRVEDLTIQKYHKLVQWFNKYYPDVKVTRIFHRHTIIAEYRNEQNLYGREL